MPFSFCIFKELIKNYRTQEISIPCSISVKQTLRGQMTCPKSLSILCVSQENYL